MAANSPLRRVIKRLLAPVRNGKLYRCCQAAAMAWDIRRGQLSEPELDLVPAAVRPGDTVVDVGANFGLYCYHLSRAVGPAGRVFAFEPIPFTCGTLRLVATILRLRNVEIVNKGCSDRPGTVTFTLPLQASGALSAGQVHIAIRNDDREGKEGQVRWRETRSLSCEVVALDQFLPPLSELSFIKCDIEGAELLALRGAERTLDRHLPTVLCEINPWFLDGFGIRLEDLTGFFFRKGYRLYRYEQPARRLEEIAPHDVVEDNYLFIHPTRRERFATFFGAALRVVQTSPSR